MAKLLSEMLDEIDEVRFGLTRPNFTVGRAVGSIRVWQSVLSRRAVELNLEASSFLILNLVL